MSAEAPLPLEPEPPVSPVPPAAPEAAEAPDDAHARRDRLGLALLGVALGLGCLGTRLVWNTSPGLNVGLWALACGLSWFALARWHGKERLPARSALLLPLFGFAVAFVWRDNPLLRALDALAMLLAASLLLWRPASGSLRATSFVEAQRGLTTTLAATSAGGFRLLFEDIAWKRHLSAQGARPLFRVLVGLALAAPLLAVFGGLFMAADARFEALARGLFQGDVETLLAQGVLALGLAWGVAGFLSQALNPTPNPTQPPARNPAPTSAAVAPTRAWRLGAIEVATVLLALDALFTVFVALQLPYLFGGAAHVGATAGLTLAEYARRGFFELAWVGALALPLLLTLHALLPTEAEREGRPFRLLAGLQLLLLGVIIASAVQRMALYQAEYGLTLLRVCVLAFEAWTVGLLLWFAATVLRGRRERFVGGTLVWGFAGLALMHAPNWEARIVESQLAQLDRGRPVDTYYLIGSSADAMPALVAGRQRLPEAERSRVAHWLLGQSERIARGDWRAWSLARARGQRAVEAERRALEADAGRREWQEERE